MSYNPLSNRRAISKYNVDNSIRKTTQEFYVHLRKIAEVGGVKKFHELDEKSDHL